MDKLIWHKDKNSWKVGELICLWMDDKTTILYEGQILKEEEGNSLQRWAMAWEVGGTFAIREALKIRGE